MSSASQKVNPEYHTGRKSARGRHANDNFAANKLGKFTTKQGGLGICDVIKAIAQIIVFILMGFLFYGVFLDDQATSGGRDEYSCATDMGETEIPADIIEDCEPSVGWRRWDWIDCAYFTMVTITTVGYGDMGPISVSAKWFTIFFILVGFVVIAGALGIIGRFFIDQAAIRKQKKQKDMEAVAMKVGQELKSDLAASSTPNQTPTPAGSARGSARKQKSFKGLLTPKVDDMPLTVEQEAFKKEVSNLIETQTLPPKDIMKVLVQLVSETTKRKPSVNRVELPPLKGGSQLPPIEDSSAALADAPGAESVAETPPTSGSTKKAKGKPLSEATKPPPLNTGPDPTNAGPVEPFAMREPTPSIWNDPDIRRDVKHKLRLCWKIQECFYIVYVFIILSFALGHIEGWNGLDSFYYAVVTGTTVGYGDKAPTTKAGRLFACFLLPLGVIGLSSAFGSMASVFEDEKQGAGETLMDKVQELERIIEQDEDGTVTEEEFTIFQLKKIYHVDDETLNSVRGQFISLDADGSGALDQDDIDQLKDTCTKMGIKSSHGATTLFRRLSNAAMPAKYRPKTSDPGPQGS